jgi:hypothetical protein
MMLAWFVFERGHSGPATLQPLRLQKAPRQAGE